MNVTRKVVLSDQSFVSKVAMTLQGRWLNLGNLEMLVSLKLSYLCPLSHLILCMLKSLINMILSIGKCQGFNRKSCL